RLRPLGRQLHDAGLRQRHHDAVVEIAGAPGGRQWHSHVRRLDGDDLRRHSTVAANSLRGSPGLRRIFYAHGGVAMRSNRIPAIVVVVMVLAVAGRMAIAAQDRFTVKAPNGVAFSEFRGYETWQDVAVSQTEESLKVIAANDAMIKAYREGIPNNGKP